MLERNAFSDAAFCFHAALKSRLSKDDYAATLKILKHWRAGFFHTTTAVAMLNLVVCDDPTLQVMQLVYYDILHSGVVQAKIFDLAVDILKLDCMSAMPMPRH